MRPSAGSAGRELQVGETIGPYRLDAVLGEGAMGIVFRAVRETDGETVALKVLKEALVRDRVFRSRFVHEARAAQEVKHKHLVAIIDAGEAEGRPYLAVAYVRGGSLKQRTQSEGPLPVEDVLDIAAGIGSGLDALHDRGLVHRDVKPSNVLLDDAGTAMLTDFGLAKGQAYTVLTRAGQVMGTLDYLAPEVLMGEHATAASDIYALGCLVFECLTGEPPFGGKMMFEVGLAHVREQPPDPSSIRPALPAALSWATLQALEKDPARRPTSATGYTTMLRVAARQPAR